MCAPVGAALASPSNLVRERALSAERRARSCMRNGGRPRGPLFEGPSWPRRRSLAPCAAHRQTPSAAATRRRLSRRAGHHTVGPVSLNLATRTPLLLTLRHPAGYLHNTATVEAGIHPCLGSLCRVPCGENILHSVVNTCLVCRECTPCSSLLLYIS